MCVPTRALPILARTHLEITTLGGTRGWLGQHYTMDPTAAASTWLEAATRKNPSSDQIADAEYWKPQTLHAVLGETVANRRYHIRLTQAIYR